MATRSPTKIRKGAGSGAAGLSAHTILETLGQRPEFALGIIDDLIGLGGMAQLDEDMIAVHILMLGTVLEPIRRGVEAGQHAAITLADDVRLLLVDAEAAGRIEPGLMMLILNQFVAANLDVGEKLQAIMLRMIEDRARDATPDDLRDGQEELRQLAGELGGNPFEIHAHLSETAEALPPPSQAKLALSLLAEADDGLTNAALGFLLNPAAEVRAAVARRLCEDADCTAADSKAASELLRRISALCNWLPTSERPVLDAAIKGMRQKGVTSASWSKPAKLEAYASGFDGSGMQGVFLIAKEGRKHSIAALIGRLGMGVRDAWVRHGASKREVEALLRSGNQMGGMAPVSIDYVALAVRHFLAGNAQFGSMPPFGLLAFAECAGLAGLEPEATGVEALVARLCNMIEPAYLPPATIDRMLAASADWPDAHALLQSWFEGGDDATKLLAGKRPGKATKLAAILAGPVNEHRRQWAEKLAWMALFTKAITDADTPWREFAIVARELLTDRPIGEIGLMHRIAEQTLEAIDDGRP